VKERRRTALTDRRAIVYGVGLAAAGAIGAAAVARARSSRPPAPPLRTEEIAPDTEGYRGGSGTPLLLLHGISVTWRSWKPVLPLLEAHHDVIAPTLLGHSGAARLADGVEPSLDALVDGVEAELDRLGLDKVHIAGNSLGGWISLELARRGRARSVVVFSPAGEFTSNLRHAALIASMTAGIRVMESQGVRLEKLARTPRGRKMLGWSQFEHPERADPLEMIADLRAIKNSPVVLPLVKTLSLSPIRRLPDPGCPVRVVWPRHDRVISYEHHGKPMMEKLPSAELVRLDGVGHVPMADDPEAVSRLIIEVTSSVDRHPVNSEADDTPRR
jgi:pimeloyl-ACP methyl ester carboxylesterase